MWCFRRAWNELGDLHVKHDSLYEKIMIRKPLRNELILYLEVPLYSFPHRIVNKWNELSEEIVKAKTVHAFKEKLDNGYRDGTLHEVEQRCM